MTPPVGGIDPHQDTFTVGIVDPLGVEITHETFANTAAGYLDAIDLLDAHGVGRVGVRRLLRVRPQVAAWARL